MSQNEGEEASEKQTWGLRLEAWGGQIGGSARFLPCNEARSTYWEGDAPAEPWSSLDIASEWSHAEAKDTEVAYTNLDGRHCARARFLIMDRHVFLISTSSPQPQAPCLPQKKTRAADRTQSTGCSHVLVFRIGCLTVPRTR